MLVVTLTVAINAQTADRTGQRSLPEPVYCGRIMSIADSMELQERTVRALLIAGTQPDSSLRLMRDALERARELTNDADHLSLIVPLFYLGFGYYNLDSLEAADSLFSEFLIREQRIFRGQDHPDVALAIRFSGTVNFERGRYGKAEQYFTDGLAMYRRLYQGDNEHIALCINYLGRVYEATGRYELAEPLYMEGLATRRRLFTSDHPDLAISINNLSVFLLNAERIQEAEPLLVEGLAMRRRLYPNGHPDLVTSITNTARCYEELARYDEAGQLYIEGLALSRTLYTAGHIELSKSLGALALFYMNRGRYAESETLLVESMTMNRRLSNGHDESGLAADLSNYAALCNELGRYEEAERYYAESIAIYRRLFNGQDHRELAVSINSMGTFCLGRGRYQEAESLLVEGLAMRRRLYEGRDHSELAGSINNMALYCNARGRPDDADALLSEALEMYRRLHNDRDHPELALAMSNKANLDILFLLSGEVESLLAEALAMYGRLYDGRDHPDLASIMQSVAYSYMLGWCYEDAAPLYLDALAMWGRLLNGREIPELTLCINNMALLCNVTGRYDDALALSAEGLAMRRRLFRGRSHPDVCTSISSMMVVYANRGRIDSAGLFCSELVEYLNQLSDYSSAFENEYEQLSIENQSRVLRDGVVTFCLQNTKLHPEFAADAANLLLNSKGRVLANIAWQQQNALRLNASDSTTRGLWQRYCEHRRSISKLYENVPADTAMYDQWIGRVHKLADAISTAAKQLAARSFNVGEARIQVRWRDIAAALKSDEAVIEITRFRHSDGLVWKDSAWYCAVVIRPGSAFPTMVRLCEERVLQRILGYPVDALDSDPSSYVHDPSACKELYDAVWGSIDSLLAGVHRVYISPDDLLNRVAFGVLQNSTGHRLQDRYELRYLTSSRDLVRDTAPDHNGQSRPFTAAVIGNPLFSADSATLAQVLSYDTVAAGECQEIAASISSLPDLPISRAAATGSILKQLSGTAGEVDTVTRILKRHGYSVALMTGARATEEAFTHLTAPMVLHIATHGFAFPSQEMPSEQLMAMQRRGGVRGLQYAQNIYLHNGLLFAGADRAWTWNLPALGIADGVVTAYDVAHLDLTATELVVLSACETGLGEVFAGEGVFGLTRAFRAAGARAVIMSLWSVPDPQTRELMVLFYINWLDKGMSKPAALNAAQREMAMCYDDPYFWAGFVLVGE